MLGIIVFLYKLYTVCRFRYQKIFIWILGKWNTKRKSTQSQISTFHTDRVVVKSYGKAQL